MSYSQLFFTPSQKRVALIFLSFFHIFIITISNYLVQIPFDVKVPGSSFEFTTTWGTLTFPFIFLATDLTVRIFGAKQARSIILCVMLPALVISYLMSTLFMNTQFQGFIALATFNLFVFRIALASFLAYVVGQLLDVVVFNRLRQLKTWWIAPTSSMIFGSALDTLVFFGVAFYQSSDVFMANNWMAIGFVDYLFKIMISLIFFVPAYGVILKSILRRLASIELGKAPVTTNA